MPARAEVHSPTVVEGHVDAPPDEVFNVFADGWLFPLWVVGATHMRAVDASWPAPGAALHHEVGAWPFTITDRTTSLVCERPRHLVLQASARPLGRARIELTLTAHGDGTHVRMAEAPHGGPLRWLDNPVQRRLLAARNRACLQRLAAVAERRTRPYE